MLEENTPKAIKILSDVGDCGLDYHTTKAGHAFFQELRRKTGLIPVLTLVREIPQEPLEPPDFTTAWACCGPAPGVVKKER